MFENKGSGPTSSSLLYMSSSFLLRSADMRETVVHLRCKPVAALAAGETAEAAGESLP